MSKVYDIITQQILEKLEAGTVPWRKPWAGAGAAPKNLVSDKDYRGINIFLLLTAGYESPYWVTYKQAKKLGGSVCKGERSTPVIFWQLPKEDESSKGGRRRPPILRYYRAFNVAQCEGLEDPHVPAARSAVPPIDDCEALVAAMPKAPQIVHGPSYACYTPHNDRVNMPQRDLFESAEEYYSTLYHELGHASGHESRLGRKAITDGLLGRGSHAYSKEELVAEMTSAFLCGHSGIAPQTLENSAAYIDGWLQVLRGEPTLVVQAAAQAQKAADYVLARSWTA